MKKSPFEKLLRKLFAPKLTVVEKRLARFVKAVKKSKAA